MLIGHYCASFIAKAVNPKIPLWILLLAAQFVDVIWAVLIMLGVEHGHLDETLPSNPLVLSHMPYSHGLVATLVWAILAYVLAHQLLKASKKASFAIAATVASHWFLDLLVHRQDLAIISGEPKFGFGLWNYPALAIAFEVVLFAACAWYFISSRQVSIAPPKRRWLIFCVALVALQFASVFGPHPASFTAMAASGLVIYVLVAFAGYWIEKKS